MSSKTEVKHSWEPVKSHFACRIDVFRYSNSKCLGFYLIDQISEEMLLQYFPLMTNDVTEQITLETIDLFQPWILIDIRKYLSDYIFEVSFSGRPEGYTLQEWWESGRSPFLDEA
jgi:hypothetical protein